MAEDESKEPQLEDIVIGKFIIRKVIDQYGEFYMVGFDWEDGNEPQGIAFEKVTDLPSTMAKWGLLIMKNKLGWEPEVIQKPGIIVPGQNNGGLIV
jgi:hypothetical protein